MRTRFFMAGAAAAIAAGALLGPAGAFASPPGTAAGTRSTTIQLTAHATKATIVDVGQQGPSAGDQQVVIGVLRRGGKQVGRFGFVCEFLSVWPNANEECSSTGRLSAGTISLEGFSRQSDNDHTWAVAGGTGTYRGASGQAHIHDVNPTTSTVTIELG